MNRLAIGMMKVCVKLFNYCFVYYCFIFIIFLRLNCFSNTCQLLFVSYESWTCLITVWAQFKVAVFVMCLCYAPVMLMLCICYDYVMLLLSFVMLVTWFCYVDVTIFLCLCYTSTKIICFLYILRYPHGFTD